MNRQSLSALAKFCVEQHETFSASAWTTRCGVDAIALAKAAEYLSLTSWYGHEEALASVASHLRADLARRVATNGEETAEDLQLAEFSIATRYLLAQRRIELRLAKTRD